MKSSLSILFDHKIHMKVPVEIAAIILPTCHKILDVVSN